MSLNLYRLSAGQVNHPDYGARLKKRSDEIYSFFTFDSGDEAQMRSRRIDFIAGQRYSQKQIEQTDYINATPYQLFSKRFVEKIGDNFSDEVQFYPCSLCCQEAHLEWFVARIMRKMMVLDRKKTIFSTLTDETTKVVSIPHYRKDIEEPFFIAKDEEHGAYWVVSELFMKLCKENELYVNFREV